MPRRADATSAEREKPDRTIPSEAAAAHASKATIYRRWPSKAILITAAMTARMDTAAFAERMDEAPDGVDLELVGPIPSALIYQRLLITHERGDDRLPEQIVDELMPPLLT
jgi:AcrR family transcriptional regulator